MRSATALDIRTPTPYARSQRHDGHEGRRWKRCQGARPDEEAGADAVQGDPAQRRLHDDGVRGRGAGECVSEVVSRGVPRHDAGAPERQRRGGHLPVRDRRDEGRNRDDAGQARRVPASCDDRRGMSVFSSSVEVVLTIAYREAVSRRHAYITLEHLLYALAHDDEGERILAACGVDLPKLRRDLDAFLSESIEQTKRGDQREPAQTAAFRRVLQTAVLHVQSAQRPEVQAGDLFAATLQQPKTQAEPLLAEQNVTRLAILEYITHGISKVPAAPGPPESDSRGASAGAGEEGSATARDPLTAYCTNLTARAQQGLLDPLIGRTNELQRTIEVLCRRRKNNPVFVGEAGVGKTAMAEGLASRLLADDIQEPLHGAEIFALDTAGLLAGPPF